MTNSEIYTERVGVLQSNIFQLLEWSEEEYCQFMYQTGQAYLHWYMLGDDWGRKKMERSKLFWNWYKIVFREYDYSFSTITCIWQESIKARRQIYKDLHCPISLSKTEKPNKVVLHELKNGPKYV